MNFQTAGLVGGVAFLLSALAGLLGGVPFFDIVVRALFWAAVGFGLALGIEAALKSLVPELFVPAEREPEADTDAGSDSPRRVDITLEEEQGRPVFEEVDDDEPPPPPRRRHEMQAEVAPRSEEPAPPPAAPVAEDDEEMPEIGAFLDAFKPNAPDDEGGESAAAPEYAEYTPLDQGERRSSQEVTIDGEVQDPVILAKAIQTVMRRDGQGN